MPESGLNQNQSFRFPTVGLPTSGSKGQDRFNPSQSPAPVQDASDAPSGMVKVIDIRARAPTSGPEVRGITIEAFYSAINRAYHNRTKVRCQCFLYGSGGCAALTRKRNPGIIQALRGFLLYWEYAALKHACADRGQLRLFSTNSI